MELHSTVGNGRTFRGYQLGDAKALGVPEISTESWPYWGCASCGKVGRLVEVVDCHPPFLPGMVVEVDASGADLPVVPLPDESGDTVEQGLGIMTAMKRAATALGVDVG